MSRILVIGGYGAFGARLSRRLAASGHDVLVAGRDIARAMAFCTAHPGCEPVQADREHGIGLVMARHRPDLVIDAAGPFQGSGHAVPEACLAMRIPYLDLADARDFVCGIGALDKEARAAGVAIISGASSVPALSGAVIRRLARGLDRVDSVDMALSASNRASAGASIAAAMLSYIGRPMQLWRGKGWTTAYGWQELRREPMRLSDGSGLRGRLVGIADVPDHAVVPDALPGRPATSFRAGTELGFQMLALWLLSWPVRWGWLRSLVPFQRPLMALYRASSQLGGDRSGMTVSLKGRRGAQAIERRWTIVATKGEGPEIPTLAAEILAGHILEGRVAVGARHGWYELEPEDFEPLFAGLSVRHETVERDLPPPLYARTMGGSFDTLPAMVRAMHDLHGDGGAAGEGLVERGSNPLARLVGALMRMPPAGTWPLHVAFAERGGRETWTRDFGGHRFTSELSQSAGLLVERFGPLRFGFDLPSDEDGLRMELRRWSVFGIPLPRLLGPRIAAREWQESDRFRFEVAVTLPLIGSVVRYAGWLQPMMDASSAVETKGGSPSPDRPRSLPVQAIG